MNHLGQCSIAARLQTKPLTRSSLTSYLVMCSVACSERAWTSNLFYLEIQTLDTQRNPSLRSLNSNLLAPADKKHRTSIFEQVVQLEKIIDMGFI